MKLKVLITTIAAFSGVCFDHVQAQNVSSPLDIQFRRQAVHRLVFDHHNSIPLSMLKPSKIINFSIEHPSIKVSGGTTSYKVDKGLLTAFAGEPSESALWIGGFVRTTYRLQQVKAIQGRQVLNLLLPTTGTDW